MTGSSTRGRYALSFTTGALLVREAAITVPLYLELKDWHAVRALLTAENLLQARTASSGFRLAREVVQRLSVFSEAELDLVRDASPSERGLLMWVAACRRYALIGEFAEEVVRERFLLLMPTLSYDYFDGLVRRKALWHPELADVKPSTLQKLRATVFRMLADAGLLAAGEIVAAPLSDRLRATLEARTPSDERFLPTRDNKEVAA